jgi:hypothetical protein
VADGPNDKVINPSIRFGRDVHATMLRYTKMPVSDTTVITATSAVAIWPA